MTIIALKKQWYEIVSPKMFGQRVIGETLAVEPKQLIGRVMDVSLVELSRDTSRFYIKVKIQIDSIDGTKAYTRVLGHSVTRERVYRMVQRFGRRVDVVQDVTTKDGVKMRVKTVFVLIKRVGTSKKDGTREMARQKIEEIFSSHTFEELMEAIMEGDLTKEIGRAASKAYPLANLEIRQTEIFQEKKKIAAS